MIAPWVRIVDLEPEGFGLFTRALSPRVYGSDPELQVLHRGGDVQAAVHSVRGGVELGAAGLGDDLARAAADLRRAWRVSRVTLVDADRVDAVARRIDDLALPQRDQWELLALARSAWWGDPGIVTDPAPPDPWFPALAQWARAQGSDWWAVVGAWDDPRLVFSLVAHVGEDGIDLLTSADHFGVRPDRGDATELVERVGREGRVGLALLGSVDDLQAVVGAPRPLEHLGRLVAERRLLDHRPLDPSEGPWKLPPA